MASNTLVQRLLWVYSFFMLYLIVASLLRVAGDVYLPCAWTCPLRMGMTYLSIFSLSCIGRLLPNASQLDARKNEQLQPKSGE